MTGDHVLVRVSPELLKHAATDDLEPVVILGIERQDDGTYDMILRSVVCHELEAEVDRYREALHAICGLSHQDVDEPYGRLLGRIHSLARRAVEPPELAA